MRIFKGPEINTDVHDYKMSLLSSLNKKDEELNLVGESLAKNQPGPLAELDELNSYMRNVAELVGKKLMLNEVITIIEQ